MTAAPLEKLIVGGLLFAVAFTALTHGAVEPWAVAMFELLILILLLLWAIKCLTESQFVLRLPITVWPIAAFFIYGSVQCVAVVGPDPGITSLSFDVEATRSAVLLLFFLLAAHIMAANFLVSEKRLYVFLRFLTIFGMALALVSLIQYFTKENIFFWARPINASNPLLTGPFVNHNHLAGYFELIIPIAFAGLIADRDDRLRVLYGFAGVIMTIAAALTVSRAGLISLVIGSLFFVAASVRFFYVSRTARPRQIGRGRDRPFLGTALFRSLAPFVLLAALIVGGSLWLGRDSIVNRLPDNTVIGIGSNGETFESSRGWIWKNSYRVFQGNPVFGTGMGTFETAFSQYSDGFPAEQNGRQIVWNRAHNDYLQVLTDTGLIGGVLALWFLITVLISVIRGSSIKDRFHAGLVIGCSTAVIMLLFHSFFDYNLQLPSTSLLFLLLTAVMASVSGNRGEKNQILQNESSNRKIC